MRVNPPLMLAALLVLAEASASGEDPGAAPPGADTPIVVELFTSQGCSSCPPADRLLSRLRTDGEPGRVVPLSFHVDYWNYIGWSDPFSSAEWSKRQSSYAGAFSSSRVYTPQLVINGRRDCVGSDEKRVREEIERAAREGSAGRLTLDFRAGSDDLHLGLDIDARVESAGGGKRWSVMVAVFENDLVTPVTKGENGGRELHNDHVVRTLTKAFSLPARPGAQRSGSLEIELEEGWKRTNLGVAVFLQDPDSRHIHGAAVKRLPG